MIKTVAKDRPRSDAHHRWASGARVAEAICDGCRCLYLDYVKRIEGAARHYCSRACQHAHRAIVGTAPPRSDFLPDDDEWLTIPSFPSYQASAAGSIRRSRSGRSNACILGKVLVGTPQPRGYLRYGLYRDDKVLFRNGHALVCEAFHGAPPTARHQAAHWDGVTANNRQDNLRWATPKENAEDCARHGRVLRGERHPNAKLSPALADNIRRLHAGGMSYETIGSGLGIGTATVGRVIRAESWL